MGIKNLFLTHYGGQSEIELLLYFSNQTTSFMLEFRGICGIKSRWWAKCPLQRLVRRQLLHAQSPDSGDATGTRISLRRRNQGMNGGLYRAQIGSPTGVKRLFSIQFCNFSKLRR